MCRSDASCGLLNAEADDQFLAGVSVATRSLTGLPDYWFSYFTFGGPTGRTLPLLTRAAYFQQGAAGVTAVANSGIDPTTWLSRNDRCTGPCFTAGDYIGVASNAQATASMPFILQSSPKNDVFQSFLQDSSLAGADRSKAHANFVPYHPGADLRSLARPIPPSAYGLNPRLRRGILDTKALGLYLP